MEITRQSKHWFGNILLVTSVVSFTRELSLWSEPDDDGPVSLDLHQDPPPWDCWHPGGLTLLWGCPEHCGSFSIFLASAH